MQDTVEVIINEPKEGVLTCTTVNQHPYPSPELFYKSPLLYDQKHKKWHKSESERKTYEIVQQLSPCACEESRKSGLSTMCFTCTSKVITYVPGTIHKAQIINGKAVIS